MPPVAVTLAAAALLHLAFWHIVAADMSAYLLPWFDHIVRTGPVAAFAAPFSNYTPPYLYLLAIVSPLAPFVPWITLIKLISVAGTGALAFAVRHLLTRLDVPQPERGAALVFLLPSVAINASLLGQADMFWAAPCVMALAAALDRRHAATLLWCGVALSFKAQAVLIAPFFLALLIHRRVPVRLWLLTPLATAAMMIPAMVAGWPPGNLVAIYALQSTTFADLSRNAPNIWSIIDLLPRGEDMPLLGLAFTAAVGASAAYIARFSAQPLHGRALIAAALLAMLVTAGLLPKMHERFFYLADIVALVLAIMAADRESWRTALLIQTGSTLALFAYLSGIESVAAMSAVPMLVATWRIARPLLQPAANDNPLLVRPI
ncbi:MAG: hypothetical protein B7Y98_10155 [Sphingomonas sp. 32-62-10]|nr:MAG: hypothetical protein B7Y98_10155 [Sphingomonas sp. 32-62-10]